MGRLACTDERTSDGDGQRAAMLRAARYSERPGRALCVSRNRISRRAEGRTDDFIRIKKNGHSLLVFEWFVNRLRAGYVLVRNR